MSGGHNVTYARRVLRTLMCGSTLVPPSARLDVVSVIIDVEQIVAILPVGPERTDLMSQVNAAYQRWL